MVRNSLIYWFCPWVFGIISPLLHSALFKRLQRDPEARAVAKTIVCSFGFRWISPLLFHWFIKKEEKNTLYHLIRINLFKNTSWLRNDAWVHPLTENIIHSLLFWHYMNGAINLLCIPFTSQFCFHSASPPSGLLKSDLCVSQCILPLPSSHVHARALSSALCQISSFCRPTANCLFC